MIQANTIYWTVLVLGATWIVLVLVAALSVRFRGRSDGQPNRDEFLTQMTQAAKRTMAAIDRKRPTHLLKHLSVKVAASRDPDGHVAGFTHFAAFRIDRWPRGQNGRSSWKDEIFVRERFKVPEELSKGWARSKTEADASVTCELRSPSHCGNSPERSRIRIREEQNDDGYRVPYGGEHPVNGRHFRIELSPSLPMWTAILDRMLPTGTMNRDRHQSYAIIVPLTDRFEGRPLALGADEPFLSEEDLPCSDLVLLQVLRRGSEVEDMQMHFLREVDG